MECIKSASRSALTAFAPDAPLLAAGTLAGAVDLSFSSSANVEIFKLDFQSDGRDLVLAGSRPSSDRFHSLSWGKNGSGSDEHAMGLLAGGLADGSISVWNPLRLTAVPCSLDSNQHDDGVVIRLLQHSGPVNGLEFSCLSPKLLASGGNEGELCIWDLENPIKPNRYPSLKNPGSNAQIGLSSVSWNPKFSHIVASTSYNGTTVVWDLQHQKPITSISDKRRCSVLQWNPDISTQLMVASDDDDSPSLKLWDLRKTTSPIKEFVGHTKGVTAMSWCPSDSSFLLTCAKDNQTICWDTTKGEIFSELPASTNLNFDIHWYTKIPGIISASSYDGKIGIYNIEASRKWTASDGDFRPSAHLRAPKWLKCPVNVSFGFGGKLVSCQPSSLVPGSTCGSEIFVHKVVTEDSFVKRSTEFEVLVNTSEKSALRLLCESKSEDSESEDDKEVWAFLKIMFEEEGTLRTKLLGHLGFTVPDPKGGNLFELTSNLSLDENTVKTSGFQEGVERNSYHIDNGEDFFNNVQSAADSFTINKDGGNGEELSQESQEPIKNVDESIMHALIVGDYKEAVRQCILADRMADALVIANARGAANGPSLWVTTRDQYLNKSDLPYLKVVSALSNNGLTTLVNTRSLSSWKETLALVCTYSVEDEWTICCDTLASRLMAVGNTLAATLCYICAGNMDKTVEIWSYKLASKDGGRSYMVLLQDLMEKIIILSLATGQKQFSASLSKIVENYVELLVSQGGLTTALGYLKLLGSEESSQELAILQNRIMLSVEEREMQYTQPSESALANGEFIPDIKQSSSGYVNESLHYYADKPQVQQQGIAEAYPQPMGSYGGYQSVQHEKQFQGNPVPFPPTSSPQMFVPSQIPQMQQDKPQVQQQGIAEAYPQPMGSYGGYQFVQQEKQFQGNPVPFQPTASPQMFVPSQIPQMQQMSVAPPVMKSQPAVRPFIPATPPTLRNVEQYQPPTLGSQMYPGSATSVYKPGQHGQVVVSSQSTMVPSINFPKPAAPTPMPGVFTPVTNPGVGPVQPSTPTQPTHTQPVVPPPAPPATVQTVDTSNVLAEFRPVVLTLMRLYNETSEALGGSHTNPAKKREIEDNSRKIGSLFAKLNNQDISPNAASKLVKLCQALDSADFAAALHIQVILTTSEWDECNFWLATLKRMIKTRQNMRPQ